MRYRDSPAARSPRLDPVPGGDAEAGSPAPHTGAELAALLRLIPGTVREVAVGHGRERAHRDAAEAFVSAWEATGRDVTAVVDWPESAASWLRPARRFTAGAPDAWVVAGAPLGWAQMSRRLAHSTGWAADRTYAFASLDSPHLAGLAGPGVLDGLRGVTADGGTWWIDDGGRSTNWPPPSLPPSLPPGEASGDVGSRA